MKALGIVRKIDDLGRICIPKEVRQTQGWSEGQPMEMFMEGNQIILRGYDKQAVKEEVTRKLKEVMRVMEAGRGSDYQRLIDVLNYLEGN